MPDCFYLTIGDTNPDPACLAGEPPNTSASQTDLIRNAAPPGGGPENFPVLRVENQRPAGHGILGRTNNVSGIAPGFNVGVWGDSFPGVGVFGTSFQSTAVLGVSASGRGVIGGSD
jgi:hypothetical protein